ncbi:MAG: leucyl/phenylalanyl-tRNA--protein transferase [Gammaproteobacteria bacterium]|nr:leucyl/phenylalanyl-tRNA--protein transferase [Gammaproteobacteria bacterium]NIR90373.1 leucyl/phenylalanyl-tRNA--protein transferase [Gammaproteobacteria bacterium]
MAVLPWLDPDNDRTPFPPVECALRDPDGLLAAGGSLSPQRLLDAYRGGIFPWYTQGQPILWWSPDPRAVLFPGELRVSHSLRKTLRKRTFRVTADTAFLQVVEACAEPRGDETGTWITAEMAGAYGHLHALGWAHSVECWIEDTLAGGLYGIGMGRVFFGESMFTQRRDASKVALVHLVRQLEAWAYGLIDCQVRSAHLENLGARSVPRTRFIELLNRYAGEPGRAGPWRLDPELPELVAARSSQ